MVNNSERAGREVPKDYREVINELVDNQGWRYQVGKGYPALFPANGNRQMAVPRTPGKTSSYRNWLALVRRNGGVWPPESRK